MPGHAPVVAELLRELHEVDDKTLDVQTFNNRRTG
jgi:hypothetical protein